MFEYLPRSLELSVIMVNRYNFKIKYDGQLAWIEDIKNDTNNIKLLKGASGVTVSISDFSGGFDVL